MMATGAITPPGSSSCGRWGGWPAPTSRSSPFAAITTPNPWSARACRCRPMCAASRCGAVKPVDHRGTAREAARPRLRQPACRRTMSRSTYPPATPGYFNIGVLHTSLTGRDGHDVYAPCSVEDLERAGYDYWALGHIHQREVVLGAPHHRVPRQSPGPPRPRDRAEGRHPGQRRRRAHRRSWRR